MVANLCGRHIANWCRLTLYEIVKSLSDTSVLPSHLFVTDILT